MAREKTPNNVKSEKSKRIDTKKQTKSYTAARKKIVALSHELYVLLKDADMKDLRLALIDEEISTIEQLRSIGNIWVFMNRHDLYGIEKRQDIAARVAQRLEALGKDETKLYILKTDNGEYKGGTPSEALVKYCEAVETMAPLKFRTSVVNKVCNGVVVVSKSEPSNACVRMTRPIAYIDAGLSAGRALAYAKWIATACKVAILPLEMVEPQPTPAVLKTQEVPYHAAPKAVEPVAAPVSVPKEEDSLAKKAEEIVLAADLDGMTMAKLAEKLRTSVRAAQNAVNASQKIISIDDKVVHEEALVDWEEASDTMENILERLMARNNGYTTAAQLYEYARMDMAMFLNLNDLDSERCVFDLAEHLFSKVKYHGKAYSFDSRSHISKMDDGGLHTNMDVYQKFARDMGGVFTEDELVDYLGKVGLKTGNLHVMMYLRARPVFLYYDDQTFITSESMGIDDAWLIRVGAALRVLFDDMGDHVVLREINSTWFHLLPALPGGREWTPLLLQSVVFHYGKKLGGAHTIKIQDTQSLGTLDAMLVRGDSEIQTFQDAVVAYVVDNMEDRRNFERDELRQIIADGGLISQGALVGGRLKEVLENDSRFAWDANGDHVTVRV